MIEAPGAGSAQSPWWYRSRSTVFGILYGVGFWLPAVVGARLGGDAAINGLFFLALFCVFACFVIRLWGSSYLQSAIVWNADARAEKLFVEGPFRYTRNPLYFGNMFMAIGFALIAPPLGSAFIIIANAFLLNALIAHEEPLLRATFGEAYERYCASVPRFWPRLRPVPAEGTLQPNIAQGLVTETFTLSLTLGMCCFLAPMPYGLYGFLAFYLFGIFSQRIFARRSA
ncbi:MAG TPA: isoprenylcysteine carboxylmethyltransferase family protein [Candidatus Acidoferrales bacterium]|nr:isoprenylcysteine carboxylmethyltransferase family protein [Candidatus Acidoferrales bacterium]